MATFINKIQSKLSPGARGAVFFGAYWGAIGAFAPFIYVYFHRLGLKDTEIGILSMTLPVCTLIITPLISRLADQKNWRVRLLTWFLLGYAIAIVLLKLPQTFIPILLLLILANTMRSPTEPLANSIIVRMANKYQANFGRIRLVGSFIFTLVSLGAGALWQAAGFDWMYPISAVLLLLAAASALMLEEGSQPTPGIVAVIPEVLGEAIPSGNVKSMLHDWVLIILLASTFMVGAGLTMANTFTNIYIDITGGGEFLMGAIMAAAALGEVPGMEFSGRVTRRIGDINTMLISYGILAVGLAGFGMVKQPWLLLFFAILRGIGFGGFFIASVIAVDRRAPNYLASTYQSVMAFFAWGLAPLLSGSLSGIIFQQLGPFVFFAICGGITILAGVFLLPIYSLTKGEAACVPKEAVSNQQ